MIPATLQKHQAVVTGPAAADGEETRAEMEVVPVLPRTLLGLELLARRPALDLRAAARLVRDDPGAVLAIFGAFAIENGNTAPTMRLEDCLAALSRERLLRALARVRGVRRSHFGAFVHHAGAVSHNASAAAVALGLAPEPARLVGLLHELGSVPKLLGWSGWPPDVVACCDRLALAHGLPPPLRQALGEVHREHSGSVWVALLRAAHELLLDPAAEAPRLREPAFHTEPSRPPEPRA